ncbi:MAG: thioredoxin domain-containing protein [Hyphomicrobium sp.]|nr:thioredoxin domain-containing protein [Hyphomicrobium sp.]
MNRRNVILGIGAIAAVGFGLSTMIYRGRNNPTTGPAVESNTLVRPHSPVLGPANAPVTIVEFFDPACETCRAMYPVVKKIMSEHPEAVRLVIRYAPFHKGSDEAVRILESARKQGMYVKVMEAMLAAQPEWADHGQPQLEKAWAVAGAAGLNVDAARKGMMAADITAVLTQDMADIREANVRQTPTFFVNGKPLPSFGVRQLVELVQSEVAATKKR